MDSIQNGGHVNTEQGNYQQVMEGTYMNQDMDNYGPNSGEPGGMIPEGYARMNDMAHSGQMSQFGSYNRPGYPNMENSMPGDYGGPNAGYSGQFQPPGSRGSFPGGSRPGMGPVRPGQPGMGMMPGPGQHGYSAGQQRMMSGQSISQQSGPTPTLNQLLQTPNSQPRYPNGNEGYSGPQKGVDMGSSNGPYGMPPGWMPNQRGMSGYPQMPMSGSSPYRGQGQQQSYNQQGFNQPAGSQYSNQGSIHQQPQPPGQPPGSSPSQQRPTPQASPHQQVSPVPSPSPAHRLTPNPSPGPTRPQPQPSPGQQRTSQASPSPSQRSSSSQLSPLGSSPSQQHPAQHNHLSSPKDVSAAGSTEDVKGGETSSMRDSSRPEPSPGSVGSRSNTPASLSGASPMPPRPPSQQDGLQNNQRMSQSPMSAPGYNQHMMPPPMGPNQMGGGYNQGNYPMRQPGPGGMGYNQQNMYNGPSQMGPGGQPMYNNSMQGAPGMNRGNYNNMYPGNMMGMNNQYGNYGNGPPGPNSQGGPPPQAPGMSSPGPPSANGPQTNVNSMGSSGNTGSNGPMPGPPAQGQPPIKGAQAAAQAAMAAASAVARSQAPGSSRSREPAPGIQSGPGRMYNNPGMGGPGMPQQQQHSMPPQQPMSPLSQMNQMGYNPSMNSMSPHQQNSLSPVPTNMPPGKMHNSSSVNSYNSEQPLPKSKSKSKSSNVSGPLQNSLQNSNIASPNMMSSPGMTDSNMSGGPRPSSTPASTLSDAGSQSNDSSSVGPVMNNDGMGQMGHHPGMPMSDNTLPHGGNMPMHPSSTSIHPPMNPGLPNDIHQQPIRTMANNVRETTMTVTQSITSPVTSLSTEAGNSNDSQPVPIDAIPALQNCIPNPTHTEEPSSEPPEKKRKTKSGGGDYSKLYDMGTEPDRRPFLERLFSFLEDKGTPISNMPVISKQPIDLYRLYFFVQEKGGMVEVTKAKKWKEICGLINVSGSASAAFTLKKNYIKFLFAFECRFDRGNMDPAPVLAQMENDLEKKRAAKQRNRAPSPGSQSSQDGLPQQYMQNDHSMGHMGQGMMGNHVMNNMGGPHGGTPMMGPNNMAGPHHMGPGMQGPGGHMMGHQNYGGNSGYMMQGGSGPNNMGPGPQGGMMGPGGPMQGPNGPPMMGPNGPQAPGMMHNNMGQHGMMGPNMPANSMMGPNMMQQGQGGPNMPGHQAPGMMPPSSMNPQMQQQQMMRGNMSQSGGPNGSMMMPPNSMQNSNMPNPNMMRSGNDNSISCQDPFADEPYKGGNASAPMPFSGIQQQNSAVPQSNSPMPPNAGQMPANGSQIPASSAMMTASGQMPPSNTTPATHNAMTSSSGPMPANNSTTTSQSSDTSTGTLTATPVPSAQQQQTPTQDQSAQPTPKTSESVAPTSESAQPSSAMVQSMHPEQQHQAPSSMPTATNTSTFTAQPPQMFNQDSNSNSSMPGEFTPRSMENTAAMPPQQMPQQQQGMPSGLAPGQGPPGQPSLTAVPQPVLQQPTTDANSSSQVSNTTNTTTSSGRQFPFGDNQFNKPDRFDQGSPSQSQPGSTPVSQTAAMNQPSGNMSQGGPMNQGPNMGQQGPMNYPQGGNMPHPPQGPPYMNPQQQPGMDQQQGFPNRFSSQGQPGQDQYNQGFHGNASPGNFGPRPPMMNNEQGYPNQPGMYGKPPMGREMQGGMYTPNKRYPDNHMEYMSSPDRRGDQGRWSPMMQRGYPNQPMPPYGPGGGMTPTGPPNMSHLSRNRMSPTPNRMRDYNMSPNKQKMGHPGMPGQLKKDTYFPMDTVESTQPLHNKRRRLTKHDVGPNGYKPGYTGARRNRGSFHTGQVEAWRIMMSLRSGLMAESTWALDTLNILLYDETTVGYFGLAHLPGLLEVLLDHLRRCLIEMFDLFEDSQIGAGHEDFKHTLVRMAILETNNETVDTAIAEEVKEINRANKTIVKIENSDDVLDGKVNGEESKLEDKEHTSPDNSRKQLNSRTNYTHITRQDKEVKLEEETDPDGLLDEKYWDVYGEFSHQSDLWEKGRGDLTEHIFTHMEDLDEHKRCRRKFFCKSMKRKAISDLNMNNTTEQSSEDCTDDKLCNTGAIKEEKSDTAESGNCMRDTESEVQSNNDNSDNEKCETSSETTDCSCEKDHTCNKFMKSVTLKSEPRDLLPDKTDSNDSTCEEKLGIDSFFRDEPRMKLAVKYEVLDENELVQICKTQFGLNTEGERNLVEDESYQRNEPPLCLTSEAQHELGRRCICVSNIFRSMSFIPGNDVEMSRHSGLVYILGKLLLLHHKHLPRSRVRRKFDRDDIDEDMVDTTQGLEEWWWDCLNVLRENTLVIFTNICAQLRLDVFPDEICKPVLDGLLHWVVCPSSCAWDPLPTVGAASVLSPLRLVLEALCKLCIHDKNVDMLLCSPPYERIVQLFSVLTKLLANKAEQVTMEFSVVLLSELVKSDSSAARGVALQHPSISLLIDFIETAEQKAVHVANIHTVSGLRDNPELMGTSLDMLRRAATVLLHLAKVPANRKMFIHHQSRLLSLVMSQILDHNVASLLSDVLFQCSSLS